MPCGERLEHCVIIASTRSIPRRGTERLEQPTGTTLARAVRLHKVRERHSLAPSALPFSAQHDLERHIVHGQVCDDALELTILILKVPKPPGAIELAT